MTGNDQATSVLAAHYNQTFAEHGATACGVDWGSQEKHQLRLQSMILKIGPEVVRKEGILDVGCGYGELLNVLKDRFAIEPAHYVGIDPCLPMIEAARTLHPEHRFEAMSFEEFIPEKSASHLFCCGIFTKKLHVSNEEMYNLLNLFFGYGKSINARSITFNAMSPLCDKQPDDLFFPDIGRIISIVRNHWSYSIRAFSISSDYLKYEMLVHIAL